MEDNIVREKCKNIRAIARQALKGNWIKVTLGVLIYSVLTGGVNTVLANFFSFTNDYSIGETTVPYSFNFGGGLYNFILLGAFTLGLSTFFLTFVRTRKADCSLVFDGFGNFTKAFLLNLVIAIKVFLWGLLFVIPGIIAAFRYSQAFYILSDHPDYKVSQCISTSCELMKGNKGKLFGLILSFIGWAFLAYALESALISYYQIAELAIDYKYYAGLAIAQIPALFLASYVEASSVVFYDILTHKLVPVADDNSDK